METSSSKLFSEANPFIGWYLVDSDKSTTQVVEGKKICIHFSRTIDDVFNDFIKESRNKTPVENYIKTSVYTYSGKGIFNDWDGRLPNLAKNPIVTEVMEFKKINDENGKTTEKTVSTPIFVFPKPYGKSHLGWSMEVLYKRCIRDNVFPHRLTILSSTLVFDDSRTTDYATALEYAAKFKEQGTEICFIHMSSKQGKPTLFPNNENDLPDGTSRYAFNLASNISKEDSFVAKDLFGYDLPEGTKWVSTFSSAKVVDKFIRLCFIPKQNQSYALY